MENHSCTAGIEPESAVFCQEEPRGRADRCPHQLINGLQYHKAKYKENGATQLSHQLDAASVTETAHNTTFLT